MYEELDKMFEIAAISLKYPAIEFPFENESQKIKIQLAGKRTIPGYRYKFLITNGTPRYAANNKWYASITKDNQIEWREPLETSIKEAILQLISNPIKEAKLRGQRFNHCCFCGLELTNKASVNAGYGPICAEKWELPWGISENDGLENL